jgi:nucleoside-diphosphate-sugar epimerase
MHAFNDALDGIDREHSPHEGRPALPGSQQRYFCHVTDVVRAMANLTDNDRTYDEVLERQDELADVLSPERSATAA